MEAPWDHRARQRPRAVKWLECKPWADPRASARTPKKKVTRVTWEPRAQIGKDSGGFVAYRCGFKEVRGETLWIPKGSLGAFGPDSWGGVVDSKRFAAKRLCAG